MLDGVKNTNFREINEETRAVWEQYPIASWSVMGTKKLAFPVLEIHERGGSRLVPRHRPYRNGAKFDDTGSIEKGWDLTVHFSNEINEPGLEINGMPLYPDVLRALIETSDLYHEEAGDLILPHRGPVRARFESYNWTERAGQRNSASLVFTFVEDNEDNVGASSYTYPTVQANASQLALDIIDTAEDIDAFSTNLMSLRQLSRDIENLSMAPANARADFENQADIVIYTIDSIINSFSYAGQTGRDQFTKPESDPVVRNLVVLKDSVAREKSKARRGRPNTVSVVFRVERTLMSISIEFSQSYTDLMELNSTLDPMIIPKGTPVKIFEVV